MSPLAPVFLASAAYALPALQRLVKGGYAPAAVITRPDRPAGRGKKLAATPVKQEAQQYGLKILQPENKGQLYALLQELRPPLLINVAYGMILPETVLNLPPGGCLNLHPSFLPRYRGAAPIHRALMAGEKETGVTLMFMAVRLDAGDIILQERVPVSVEDNYGTLHDRLAEVGADLLLEGLKLFDQGQLPRIPQDDRLATFAPPLTREEEKINWSEPAEKIFNLVRALAPSPGAFTSYRGMRLKIWKTGLPEENRGRVKGLPGAEDTLPGTLSFAGTSGLAVCCGSGLLPLLEVQPESKRRMEIKSFIQGYRVQEGERFA